MRGPGLKLELEVRRLWRCPLCQAETLAPANVTAIRCGCRNGQTLMVLAVDKVPLPKRSWDPSLAREESPRFRESPEGELGEGREGGHRGRPPRNGHGPRRGGPPRDSENFAAAAPSNDGSAPSEEHAAEAPPVREGSRRDDAPRAEGPRGSRRPPNRGRSSDRSGDQPPRPRHENDRGAEPPNAPSAMDSLPPESVPAKELPLTAREQPPAESEGFGTGLE